MHVFLLDHLFGVVHTQKIHNTYTGEPQRDQREWERERIMRTRKCNFMSLYAFLYLSHKGRHAHDTLQRTEQQKKNHPLPRENEAEMSLCNFCSACFVFQLHFLCLRPYNFYFEIWIHFRQPPGMHTSNSSCVLLPLSFALLFSTEPNDSILKCIEFVNGTRIIAC